MKKWIYGRRQGSTEDYSLLVESAGVVESGTKQSDELLFKQYEFEMRNLSRNVDMFREKGLEGYVLLEGDSTQHRFSPNEEFKLAGKTTH